MNAMKIVLAGIILSAVFFSSAATAQSINIQVESTQGYAFGSEARFVPYGTEIELKWQAVGVTRCQVGQWAGISGSQKLFLTESLNLAAACETATGQIVTKQFGLVVSKSGSFGLCEGTTGLRVGEEAKFFMVATGDYVARWATPGGNPSDGQTPQSTNFAVSYAKAGTYEAVAMSESGNFIGRCQVQVFEKKPAAAMVKISLTRTEGAIRVETLETDLPAGYLEFSNPALQRSPFGQRSAVVRLFDGIKYGTPLEVEGIPDGVLDVIYRSADNATTIKLRLDN